jgi:hypothetical protein
VLIIDGPASASFAAGAILGLAGLLISEIATGYAEIRTRCAFSAAAGGRARTTHMGRGWREIGRMAVRLYQARSQGQTGQVGAAAAAGLVPDPVQVRADRADADVQLVGDLGVGAA